MGKSQKGQSIVEFAFILPILVLFMIGLMYFGLMFSNYVALNDFARDAARSAAMMSDVTYKANGDEDPYSSIRQAYVDTYENSSKSVALNRYFLPNGTYLWDPSKREQFWIEYKQSGSNNGEVIVTLKANLNKESGSLAGTFSNIIGDGTLDELVVTYHMYSEVPHQASSGSDSGSSKGIDVKNQGAELF